MAALSLAPGSPAPDAAAARQAAEDAAAARQAHPEAAAVLQRAEDALEAARQTGDMAAIARARLFLLRVPPSSREKLAAIDAFLEQIDPNLRGAEVLEALRHTILRLVERKEEFLARRSARRAELEARRRELHVFLLATAEPKQGEATFVLRNAARVLRQIGEFLVGPRGSARREEAADFARVSHFFLATPNTPVLGPATSTY